MEIFVTPQGRDGRGLRTALAGIACLLSVLALTLPGAHLALAITLLSFWHYVLYWLAYRYGAVPHGVFKRDAVAAKSVSLLALGYVYFSVSPDVLSLVVLAAGFALNAAAARVLGADRTYYGHEVAGLSLRRITSFPYSWVAHPMLVGNFIAFGGTLLNAGFRAQWWPLAFAHMVLNIGLLLMETRLTPGRGRDARAVGARSRVLVGAGMVAAGAALGTLAGLWMPGILDGALAGAAAGLYAHVIFCSYTSPTMAESRATALNPKST